MGRSRSRKGTKEPRETEGRSLLAWLKFEGKAKTNVSQDVMQGSTVTALKHYWKSKNKRKQTHGKSLREPMADWKSPSSKPQLEKVWQTHPGTVRSDRETSWENQAEHGPGVSLT